MRARAGTSVPQKTKAVLHRTEDEVSMTAGPGTSVEGPHPKLLRIRGASQGPARTGRVTSVEVTVLRRNNKHPVSLTSGKKPCSLKLEALYTSSTNQALLGFRVAPSGIRETLPSVQQCGGCKHGQGLLLSEGHVPNPPGLPGCAVLFPQLRR
ncbi:hypothetical protein NDU88_002952 [Pleurodeles waltl]|uniref:Uncharacterized protein n=1 Tax=Pleurodeles waltl TaxID=8319 RepID=A0AAV7P8G0_PLEWA|nr:hypothetical protein NDU88_002952 [Pleurodeles waltl]